MVFGSKPGFSKKTDEQLWYEIAENLDELKRRDQVNYRVRATPDSVKEKLISMGLARKDNESQPVILQND